MGTSTQSESRENNGAVTAQDILAVASGIASEGTANRVWAESVSDRALRNRVAWSLPPEDEEEQIADAATASETSDGVPERLQQRMRTLTERFVRVQPERLADRVLGVWETLLHLPCLSPAMAASEPSASLGMTYQTVLTAEGVRVEFQELPSISSSEGASPMLRVIVDASVLEGEGTYKTATLTIAEGQEARLPLVVLLNSQARGLLDVPNLPPSALPRRLVAVRLSSE